ncbi:molecular chaperone DnaK, partial [Candidatus Bathyarchaeota archaeon]|nr:molecular chaperone DnaK [Candidatus Bathyarchaeota archaeon]
RTTLTGKDVAAIKSRIEDLSKVLQEVGTSVYQQATQKTQGQSTSESKSESGERKGKVVDADYKVVNESKKP